MLFTLINMSQVIKPDEIKLLLAISNKGGCDVRSILEEVSKIVPYNRCIYYLNKWSAKGLYDYGVALDLGWLTEEGVKFVENLNNVASNQPVN